MTPRGTNIFRNPGIEVGSATSAFIIYEHVNAVSDADANGVNLVSVTYNPDTNRFGIPNIFSFGSEGTGEGRGGSAIATLSNGNFADVYGNINVGTSHSINLNTD